ncbi:MAG: cyclic lactone autoinducer peptide [Firmicutes bacterium]|nr:cyclic lactone autoinducer peptide [Bacillota bacterium]
MKKFGASLVIVICTILAMLSICSACWFINYQPGIPKKPPKVKFNSIIS